MNARNEFLTHTKGLEIKCVHLVFCAKDIILKTKYSKEDYDFFLNSLEFDYDDGYGGQNLFGIIWYENGCWSERGEYDGSEWYEYKSCPNIPDNVRSIDNERDCKIKSIINEE